MSKLKIKIGAIRKKFRDNFDAYFPEYEGKDDEEEIELIFDTEMTQDKFDNVDPKAVDKALENIKKGKGRIPPIEVLKKAENINDFNAVAEKPLFSKINPVVLFRLTDQQMAAVKELATIQGEGIDGKAMDPKDFNKIAVRANYIPYDPKNLAVGDSARKGLRQCVDVMLKADIPFTEFFRKNKIDRVLELKDEQLAGAGHLLDYFHKNGDLADSKVFATNTLDYILDNKFTLAQAEKMTRAFDAIKGVGLTVRGNRQPVMDLVSKLKDLPPNEQDALLDGVNEALEKLNEKRVKLDQKDLDVLLAGPGLKGKGQDYARCVAAMKANGIELTFPMIDLKPRDTIINPRRMDFAANTHNIRRMAFMTPEQLAAMATVLEGLAAQAPGKFSEEGSKSFLDERTFNYIIDRPDLITGEKASAIVKAFDALRANDISLEGLRQPIMAIENPKQIERLAGILDQQIWKAEPKSKLDKDEIKSLCKCMEKSKDIDPEVVGKSLKALKDSGLSMTTLNPYGTDRIEQIITLEKEGAVAVQGILSALANAKALDRSATDIANDTFDYLIENANKPEFSKPTDNPAIPKRDAAGKPLQMPPAASKADLIADVFTHMHKAEIPIVGNRRPIMDLNPTQINNLLDIVIPLNSLKKEDQLNKSEVSALIKQLDDQKALEPGYGKQLGECIAAMRMNKISLTSALPGEDNLSQLASLSKAELAAVTTTLKALKGDINTSITDPRNVDIFNHLMKPETLDNLTKEISEADLTLAEAEILRQRKIDDPNAKFSTADRLAGVYTKMKDAQINIEVVGHRRPLMDMDQHQLKNLSEILGPMSSKFKQEGGVVESLSKKEFKALIEHVSNFDKIDPPDPKRGDNLGKCISAMRENKISLTTLDPTRDHNLDRLAGLKTGELQAVTTVLDTLANTKDAEGNIKSSLGSTKSDLLNNATFDYLMKEENRQALSEFVENKKGPDGRDLVVDGKPVPITKADLVAEVFKNMNAAGIDIAGHRQAIMDICKTPDGAENLKNLAAVLKPLSEPRLNPPLDKDEFKALTKELGNLKTEAQGKLLGECMGHMRAQNIPLRSMLPGEDNLTRLAALTMDELTAVEKVMKGLKANIKGGISDPRNVDIFNYLIENAGDLKGSLGNNLIPPEKADQNLTKADRLVGIFNDMEGAKIDLVGHRRPVMNMNAQQLTALSIIIGKLNPAENTALSAREFGALIKDPAKLSGANNQAENLGNCIKALHDNGISLTTMDPRVLNSESSVKHKITALALLDPETELPAVATILTSLAGNPKAEPPIPSFLDGSYSDFYKGDIAQFIIENASELGKNLSLPPPETKKVMKDGAEVDVPRTKADLIADVFQEMRKGGCQTELTGNRRPIMKLEEAELKELRTVLKGFNKDSDHKFSKDSMEELVKYLPEIVKLNKQTPLLTKLEGFDEPPKDPIQRANYDAQLQDENKKIMATNAAGQEQKDNLLSCIDNLKKNGVGLTNWFKENKIERLMKLPAEQLAAVTKVMESLGKKGQLDADTFDNIMKHAENLAKPAVDVNGKPCTRAHLVVQAFDKLDSRGVELKGVRDPIMSLSDSDKAQERLNTFIKMAEVTPAGSEKGKIKALVDDVKKDKATTANAEEMAEKRFNPSASAR